MTRYILHSRTESTLAFTLAFTRHIDRQHLPVETCTDGSLFVLQAVTPQGNAVRCQLGLQLIRTPQQVAPGHLVRMFTGHTAGLEAENVRKEQLGVIPFRLEEHDIRIRVLLRVLIHTRLHA
jgi:hypothetical protein